MKNNGRIAELFERYNEDISTISESLRELILSRNKLLEEFNKTISKDNKELLDKFLLLYNDVVREEKKNSFVYGFTLAMQLMNEAMGNEVI